MSNINITSGYGWTKVSVDGVELRHLTGLSLEIKPNALTEVRCSIAMQEGDFSFDGAKLTIGGCEMPEALEVALLDYLIAKRPMRALVSPMTSAMTKRD